MSNKTTIDEKQLIKNYEKGLDDKELSELHNVSERTIRYRLQDLRSQGKTCFRSELNKNTKANISKPELLKLLAIFKSKSMVSKQLEIPLFEITRLCEKYNIIDNATYSLKINEALKQNLTKYSTYSKVKTPISGSETVVIGLADWHAGKDTATYNLEVFKKSINELLNNSLKLIDKHISKHVKIDSVKILSAGDMANGEGIYPTQAFHQDEAPPTQVMLVVEYMMKIIMSLLERGLAVDFYGVKGNHGRLGKDADPASNWDLMIYMILAQNKNLLNLKNLTVNFNELDYLEVPIRNWKYLLRHEAYAQDETPVGQARYLGWQKIHDADVIVSAHVHHWSVGERKIVIGSPVGGDDLSERMASTTGNPSQMLWLCTDERSHTNFYPVDLKSKGVKK